MNFRNLSLLLLVSFFFAACSNSTDRKQAAENAALEQEEQLWDEVMVIHDEVMPKMSNINRLSRLLRDQLGSEDQSSKADSEAIKANVKRLDAAEEGMWAWMNNLKQLERLREETNHEGVMEYLNQEKKEIEKVRDDMLSAIEAAEELIQQLESK